MRHETKEAPVSNCVKKEKHEVNKTALPHLIPPEQVHKMVQLWEQHLKDLRFTIFDIVLTVALQRFGYVHRICDTPISRPVSA